jgi:hypothetical protein
MTQDDAGSAPMRGSHGCHPNARLIVSDNSTIDEYRTALQKCVADKAADWKAACDSAEAASKEITRLKLTRYERHCIERVRDTYADEDDVACNEIAAVLDGLLERTK